MYSGQGFVDKWCFLRAARSISVDAGHGLWVVVVTIAFEYCGQVLFDQPYIFRAVHSILIDVVHRIGVLSPARFAASS